RPRLGHRARARHRHARRRARRERRRIGWPGGRRVPDRGAAAGSGQFGAVDDDEPDDDEPDDELDVVGRLSTQADTVSVDGCGASFTVGRTVTCTWFAPGARHVNVNAASPLPSVNVDDVPVTLHPCVPMRVTLAFTTGWARTMPLPSTVRVATRTTNDDGSPNSGGSGATALVTATPVNVSTCRSSGCCSPSARKKTSGSVCAKDGGRKARTR